MFDINTNYNPETGLPAGTGEYHIHEMTLDIATAPATVTLQTPINTSVFGRPTTIPTTTNLENFQRLWLARTVSGVKRGGTPLGQGVRLAKYDPVRRRAVSGAYVGNFGAQVNIRIAQGTQRGVVMRFEFEDTNITINGTQIRQRVVFRSTSLVAANTDLVIRTATGFGHVKIFSIQTMMSIEIPYNVMTRFQRRDTMSTVGDIEFGIYTGDALIEFNYEGDILAALPRTALRGSRQYIVKKDQDGNVLNEFPMIFDTISSINPSATKFRLVLSDDTLLLRIQDFRGKTSLRGQITMRDLCDQVFGADNWATFGILESELDEIFSLDGYIHPMKNWDVALIIADACMVNISYREGSYELWRVV
jgi:hypothetical protein